MATIPIIIIIIIIISCSFTRTIHRPIPVVTNLHDSYKRATNNRDYIGLNSGNKTNCFKLL